MNRQSIFRFSLVLALFVVIQGTLGLNLHIDGVHPDLLVVLPIVAGVLGGPSRGAYVGFAVGLVADLFLPTPYGLSALTGVLVGFGVGGVTVVLDRSALWLPPVAALLGTAIYEVVFGFVGVILGQGQMLKVNLVLIVLVSSLVNAALALPAMRMVAWALPEASTEGVPTSTGSTKAAW